MKNTQNKCAKMRSILATQIRRICAIAFVAVIGFSVITCDDGSSGTSKLSGTAIASEFYRENQRNPVIGVVFNYQNRYSFNSYDCTITTNLPAPNDSFIIGLNGGRIKYILDLTPGQEVKWTAKVEEGTIENRSDESYMPYYVFISGKDNRW